MGRLKFYLCRAMQILKGKGLKRLFKKGVDFLKRRKFFLQFLTEWYEYHFTSFNRSIAATLIRELKREPVTSKKVLLYASFDSASVIKDHVVKQIKFFHSRQYEIIFVSTSKEVSTFEFEKISAFVKIGLHRDNLGYDFASWSLAHSYLSSFSGDSLIQMNDSCLGPVYNFEDQLKLIEQDHASVFGMSKCYEIAEYIQSYFLHFGKETIKNGIFLKYFARIRILESKWAIVRFLEIGGSVFLKKNGIELKALIDPIRPEVAAEMRKREISDPVQEPLASLWNERLMMPFYKRSNLRTLDQLDP